MDHPTAPPRSASEAVDRTCEAFAATLALKRLRRMWTTPILTLLLARPMRFNELQRALAPVSAKVLAARLAAMRSDGLLIRDERVAEPPKEVVYALTAEGVAVRAALEALAAWHDRTARPVIPSAGAADGADVDVGPAIPVSADAATSPRQNRLASEDTAADMP